MRIRLTVLAVLALALAGCSSSSPPSARAVALRIPGCHPRAVLDVPVQATAEVTCDAGPVADGLPRFTAWVATFASASLERSWLIDVGNGGYLPPGVCVQGAGWAADLAGAAAGTRALIRIAHAAGGRVVSAGSCF